jgi:hypothetical protein
MHLPVKRACTCKDVYSLEIMPYDGEYMIQIKSLCTCSPPGTANMWVVHQEHDQFSGIIKLVLMAFPSPRFECHC